MALRATDYLHHRYEDFEAYNAGLSAGTCKFLMVEKHYPFAFQSSAMHIPVKALSIPLPSVSRLTIPAAAFEQSFLFLQSGQRLSVL